MGTPSSTPSTLQKIGVALGYAVVGAFAVIQTTGVPHTPEGWVGLASAFALTFWGKFSSSRTVIAANFNG